MPTLHWIGKDKVINHHREVHYKVLEHGYGFDADKGKTKQPTGNGNMVIHGDNLEALKSLLPEYEGKVKCIYIDPPYNTGNEGWVYNDNVNDPRIKKWLGDVVGKEGEDLSRHDKWLCMMYPRLILLRKMLAEDGAIFISINEDEQANLKLILDEVFGASNYLTMFTIKLRHEERILKGDKDFHEVTEQLFHYRKSQLFKPIKKHYDNTSIDDYVYEVKILEDCSEVVDMDGKLVKKYQPNQFEVLKLDPSENLLKKINIRGTLKEGNSSGRFYMKHFHPIVSEAYGCLFAVPDMGDDATACRYFLLPKNAKKANGDYFQGVPQNRSATKEVPYPNYFDFTDEFNRVGYEGGVDFRFGKKPTQFLKRVFEIAGLQNQRNAVVLDSFAGSGSTAHAVLNLNKQDGGNRKFILIEMMDYAETITAERVKRVMNGYGEGNKKTEGTGGAFDYYTLGLPLFNAQHNLNEEVGTEKIREYIWYSETRTALAGIPGQARNDGGYYLGTHERTAFYFVYEKDALTTLDHELLATLTVKGERTVIYADNCLLPKKFLEQHGIVFKKIPRDISRF